MIRLDHTLKLYESLRQSQLLVVSGTTHGVTKECPNTVNDSILRFLKNPVWVDPYLTFGEDVKQERKPEEHSR